MNKIIALCTLLLCLTTASAQGVFVTEGENGPVFSNRPQPGAREVTLPPLSVVPAVRPRETPPRPEAAQPAVAPAPAYSRFAIEFPEQNGALTTGTGLFNIYLAIEPALRQGHAFTISIDGRPANVRFSSPRFMLPENFWGNTLPPAGVQMQLDANIVDANGEVLMKAEPVRFVIHYHQGRPPVAVHPLPQPIPVAPVGR